VRLQHHIKAQDITINGSLTGAGDFAVTLIGQKPVSSC